MFKKIAILSVSALALAACGRVPPGHEGVVVNLYGDGKGVQAQEVGTGWQFYGMGKELYNFPLFKQNITWEGDDGIGFQDRDGLSLRANVGLTYKVRQGSSAELFIEYRAGIREITDVFVKNMVRDEFNRAAASMTAEEIYSTKKNILLDTVAGNVRKKLDPLGLELEEMFWVGALALPQQVRDAINTKIQATQDAAKVRNQVAQAAAEADKQIETSRGVATSIEQEARARALAIELEGKALQEYPNVLRLREVQKWNGVVPQTLVTDGNASILLQTGK